ncbi:MAG: peptidylprolyl isomerase [Prevotella sp.]|nr:peptidylprolyl isomerase [Prevotella sp.]
MRKLLFTSMLLFFSGTVLAQTVPDTVRNVVLLQTTMGDIRIALFNETPLHRDNFIKLVEKGKYDGVLFHRVIKDFMIQTGDLGSVKAKPGEELGETPEKYKVPAEIRYPLLFHRRGMVAAAREADRVNPKRESSASQFYIVYGWNFNEAEIELFKHKLDSTSGGKHVMPPEVMEAYVRYGGTPHLDGAYTVFGEVLEGMDVVEKIQSVETDPADRPKEDIRIIKASILHP